MATLEQLQSEKGMVQERYQEKYQAASEGRASFKRGEISAKKLDNIERNLDREGDKRSRDFVRIDKAINDIEIRRRGATTARQKERPGAFLTEEEKRFERGDMDHVVQVFKSYIIPTLFRPMNQGERKHLGTTFSDKVIRTMGDSGLKKKKGFLSI